MDDYYKVLGVCEGASQDDIKKSYRKLSLEYHPDRPSGNAEKFKKISEAYEVIGDNSKRQEYDMKRKNPFVGGIPGFVGGGAPPEDLLNMFFGGGMFGGGSPFGAGGPFGGNVQFEMPGGNSGQRVHIFRNGVPINIPRKPEPMTSKLEITLNQAYNGAKIPLEINRTVINNNERTNEKEVLYVDIPVGTDDNEMFVIKEKGTQINGMKGDIKVSIKVKNDTNFTRRGLDLIYEKQITLKESLIGFTFNIEHLSGKNYTINNNTGNIVTNEHLNVVKNMGMRRERAHPASPMTGDLIIKFKIIYPESLTEEQKAELAKIL